jgi:translation initiation factor 1
MSTKEPLVSSSSNSDKEVEDLAFGDYLRDLDRDQVRIIIREETRRFRKPTTLISGLPTERGELQKVAHELKKSLATGGSAKDGQVILQGDKREDAKQVLVKLGYSASNIEVQ